MPNKNLLSVVQGVMTVLGSDTVDSIHESPEAEDVASIARDIYYDIITWDEWPSTLRLTSLEPVSDSNAPTVFKLKENNLDISKVQYLIKEHDNQYFANMCYLEPEVFLEYADAYVGKKDTVESTGYGLENTFVVIKTDASPRYYTSFDNEHIIFDSYQSSVETNMQSSKLRVLAHTYTNFKLEDEYEIPFPNLTLYNLYLAELRSACSYYLNQQESPQDQKRSLRQLSKLRNTSSRIVNEPEEHYPQGKYGRRGSHPNLRKMGRR